MFGIGNFHNVAIEKVRFNVNIVQYESSIVTGSSLILPTFLQSSITFTSPQSALVFVIDAITHYTLTNPFKLFLLFSPY